MRLSLCIAASRDSLTARQARRFCESALRQRQTVYRVFFQGPGVDHATDDRSTAYRAWTALARAHNLDLVVCSGGLQRQQSVPRALSLPAPWSLGGLTLLLDAAVTGDRLVHFTE